jgi:hypothetical protein
MENNVLGVLVGWVRCGFKERVDSTGFMLYGVSTFPS